MKPHLNSHICPYIGRVWNIQGPILVIFGCLSVKNAIESYYRILKERNLEHVLPQV